MLFISAILVYFSEIKGNVLDADADNTVDINEQYQSNYAKLHGDDPTTMSVMEIRQYNTGDTVALVGNIRLVDAMENLTIDFTL